MVSGGIFWWAMMLLAVNLVVSLLNLRAWYPAGARFGPWLHSHWPAPWTTTGWGHYWMVTAIAFPFIIALATLVWFGIGGVRDIVAFFRDLKTMARDTRDDGRVPSKGEVPIPAEVRGVVTPEQPPSPAAVVAPARVSP
jgi:hypothetical protein